MTRVCGAAFFIRVFSQGQLAGGLLVQVLQVAQQADLALACLRQPGVVQALGFATSSVSPYRSTIGASASRWAADQPASIRQVRKTSAARA